MSDPEHFRRDQTDGISPPNLADESSYAEHIVHRRGKRTRFTSVSTDPNWIRDFGDQLWKLLTERVRAAGHGIVLHADLMAALRADVQGQDADAREIAMRAIPRATLRKEALVRWNFDRLPERKDC